MFRVAALPYWYQFPQVFIYNLMLHCWLPHHCLNEASMPPLYSNVPHWIYLCLGHSLFHESVIYTFLAFLSFFLSREVHGVEQGYFLFKQITSEGFELAPIIISIYLYQGTRHTHTFFFTFLVVGCLNLFLDSLSDNYCLLLVLIAFVNNQSVYDNTFDSKFKLSSFLPVHQTSLFCC